MLALCTWQKLSWGWQKSIWNKNLLTSQNQKNFPIQVSDHRHLGRQRAGCNQRQSHISQVLIQVPLSSTSFVLSPEKAGVVARSVRSSIQCRPAMVLLSTHNYSISTLLRAKVPHQAEMCPDMSKNLKLLLKYNIFGDSQGESNVGLSE